MFFFCVVSYTYMYLGDKDNLSEYLLNPAPPPLVHTQRPANKRVRKAGFNAVKTAARLVWYI